MHPQKLTAFADELSKIAKVDWHTAADVAGLGVLAAPHAYNLVTGKKVKHKTERNTELAGLGMLIAPSVHKLVTKTAMTMRAGRPAIGTLAAGARQGAFKPPTKLRSTGASPQGNPTNFVPPTPATGSSWMNNPRAISI